MLPFPIPWYKIWQYKAAIPIVLVMLFAFFAVGAEVGAQAHNTGNDALMQNVTDDDRWHEARERGVQISSAELANTSPLTLSGARLVFEPMDVSVSPIVRDGVIWGFENPDIGIWMIEIANVVMVGTLLAYLYVAYRSVGWVFRW